MVFQQEPRHARSWLRPHAQCPYSRGIPTRVEKKPLVLASDEQSYVYWVVALCLYLVPFGPLGYNWAFLYIAQFLVRNVFARQKIDEKCHPVWNDLNDINA